MANNRKVVILADSTCDLSPELKKEFDIRTIPLYVTLNDNTYRDMLNIVPDDIYKNYNEKKQLPKTAAASIQDNTDFIAENIKDAEGAVYITISSSMSCNHNNARLAAEEFENVYVVDSMNLSTGIGLLVLYAADLADQGKSAKEISEAVSALRSKVDASFVVDNLEYLHKGGRCSSIAALGANILKLRPCIMVRNGTMGVGKKYRGAMKNVLVQYADEMLADLNDIDTDRIFITNSGCDPEIIDAVYQCLKEKNVFKNIYITRAGCTISSHCGYGTLGVLFIRKSNVK